MDLEGYRRLLQDQRINQSFFDILLAVVNGQTPLGSGPIIQVEDLPIMKGPQFPEKIIPLREVERRAIQNALTVARGDKLVAARLLGIGKTTMYRKLRNYHEARSS